MSWGNRQIIKYLVQEKEISHLFCQPQSQQLGPGLKERLEWFEDLNVLVKESGPIHTHTLCVLGLTNIIYWLIIFSEMQNDALA